MQDVKESLQHNLEEGIDPWNIWGVKMIDHGRIYDTDGRAFRSSVGPFPVVECKQDATLRVLNLQKK